MAVYLSVLLCDKKDVTTEDFLHNHRALESHLQIVDQFHDDWVEIFGSYEPLYFRPTMEALLGVKLEGEDGSVGEAFPSTEPDFDSKILAVMIRINKALVAIDKKGASQTNLDIFYQESYTRLNTLLIYMCEQVDLHGKHAVLRWS
jgi:hypothetical protein